MTESLNVDIILEEDTPNIDVDVENQAAALNEILRNDTLTGDGIDTPLGVNTETIATVTSLNQGLDLKQDKGDYAIKDEIPDLTDYVKNTDVATSKDYGVVKVSGQYGVGHNTTVGLFVPPSTISNIDGRGTSTSNKPLTLDKLDYAIKVSLTTNKETLTDEEKVSACNWLGTAKTVSLTEAAYDALETKDSNTLYLIEE